MLQLAKNGILNKINEATHVLYTLQNYVLNCWHKSYYYVHWLAYSLV